MSYVLGDLVLVDFPFSNFSSLKPRPALILISSTDNDYVVSRVSASQYCSENDIPLLDWKQENLFKESIVKLDKLVTVNETLIKGSMGFLSDRDLISVQEKFQIIFDCLLKNRNSQ